MVCWTWSPDFTLLCFIGVLLGPKLAISFYYRQATFVKCYLLVLQAPRAPKRDRHQRGFAKHTELSST